MINKTDRATIKDITPLFSEKEIKIKVEEISNSINNSYNDCKELVVLVVMKGAFLFASDLIRSINIPVVLDFIELSSYGSNRVSSGVVTLKNSPQTNFKDRDILIIEDIVETGHTLNYLLDLLRPHNPKSIKIAAIINKCIEGRKVKPDFYGFEVEDQFLVGYGLDINEKFRNLPFIGYLNSHI